MAETTWNRVNPPAAGYYLATWMRKHSKTRRVSELWWSEVSGWVSCRSYFPLGRERVCDPMRFDDGYYRVIAWRPMPEPYSGRPM